MNITVKNSRGMAALLSLALAVPASAADLSATNLSATSTSRAKATSKASQKAARKSALRASRKTAALPTFSPAYLAADAAYKAYDRRDHPAAVTQAREASRLAPANADYRVLLVNSLIAAGQFEQAQTELDLATQAVGNKAKFEAPQDTLRRAQALAAGMAMYAALDKGNIAAATAQARTAVQLAPKHNGYRLALVNVLLQGGQFAEADQAATDAVALLPQSPVPLMLRAHARQQLTRWPEARADQDSALRLALTPEAQRPVRLIAADAALAAREPQRALALLAPLAEDAQVSPRRVLAQQAVAQQAVAQLAVPGIDCANVETTLTCALLPGTPPLDPGYTAATAAYKAMQQGTPQTALEQARLAVGASPGNRNYQLLLMNAASAASQPLEAEQAASAALALNAKDGKLLARRAQLRRQLGDETGSRQDLEAALALGLPAPDEVSALADLGRKSEARARLAQAREAGGMKSATELDLAYLANRVGDDEAARQSFARADAAGALPVTSLQDAAYAAMRTHNDDEAVGYFKRTIDAAEGLKLKLEPQLLYNTRRAVADISRKWGVLASLTYRNGGATPGFGLTPGSAGSKTLQAGVEAYWRPWGWRSGEYVELFARGFDTLYSQSGGATGGDSLQGALGIRWKPLSSTNGVLSLSRVFTRNAADDWLAQAAWSWDQGSDLRVDAPSWWTTHVNAEVGRYVNAKQTYGLASVVAGCSYLVGDEGRTVLFPHAVAAVEYDSSAAQRTSAGAGPGVSLRHWFREDRYNAPRSYVDVTLQYRAHLAGDNRAKGLFINTIVNY
jgi:adsorption protein A